MKKMLEKKLKNFTIEVIDFFLGLPEAIAIGFDRKEFYRILQGRSTEKELTCANIASLINNMKKSGYVTVRRGSCSASDSIVFTNKSKLAVVDRIIMRQKIGKHRCFISFDIPERLRLERDRFRRVIKRMGFVQIQKSLWVCERDLGEFVDFAAIEYGVSDYVVYIVSTKTNIDEFIDSKLSHLS